jgi:cysteinyl-tRNA synthetase
MSEIKIYNTLTQEKEVFTPLEPGHVKMYVCGPTVYDLLHIGNFRGPIFFNFVRHYLEHRGFKVTYVYNYTDVDDKIIKTANEQKITAFELADKYVAEFEKDFKQVGLTPATVNPRVTTHIKEIIEMIEKIIRHGHAYEIDGEVFCGIETIKDYGKLSHKNIDDLVAGARVEIGEKKKNPLDFSLWKPAKAGEPFWESPWGKGRPGWHIECSAMAKKYLGDSFDIHGGGIDLIFPHHENEIAQSESANNKPFVRYWMHNNFINMGKEKMSKSLGNIFTARHFIERYNGEVLKFLMLSSHYRSASDFSSQIISHSISGLARIYSSLSQAKSWLKRCEQAGFKPLSEGSVSSDAALDLKNFKAQSLKFNEQIEKAAADDFNTPEMMGDIFSLVRSFNTLLKPSLKPTQELANSCELFLNHVRDVGKWMALFQSSPQVFLMQLDDMLLNEKNLKRDEIQTKVSERVLARAQKDFASSDRLRDELVSLGIELRDTQEGTEWEVKK